MITWCMTRLLLYTLIEEGYKFLMRTLDYFCEPISSPSSAISNKNWGSDAMRGRCISSSPKESFLEMFAAVLRPEALLDSSSGSKPLPVVEVPPQFICWLCTMPASWSRQQKEFTFDMIDLSSEAGIWESVKRDSTNSNISWSRITVLEDCGFLDANWSDMQYPSWLIKSLIDIEGLSPGTVRWSQQLWFLVSSVPTAPFPLDTGGSRTGTQNRRF